MSLPRRSTLNSAGCFRVCLLLLLGGLLLAAPAGADVCVWRDPERTMQKIFPQAHDYKTITVKMTPEKIAAIEKRLGSKLDDSEKAEFNFYDIMGAGKGHKIGTIIALAGTGEYGAIEVVIGVDGKGKIVGAYIQRSRERTTKALRSPKFLGQFTGLDKENGFEVGKDIKPASAGAEPSSKVVAFVVRKMLVFHDVLTKGGSNP